MDLINRSAVIVKAKQPYIDWANHFDDGGPTLTLEDARTNASVFLVDDIEDEADSTRCLKKFYGRIFRYELQEWVTDPKTWPQARDLKTFLDWFDVEIVMMVIDASRQELDRELY